MSEEKNNIDKSVSAETDTADQAGDKEGGRFFSPIRELSFIINFVTKIYSELGNGLYHSKEDIAKIHKLAVNSIKSILSTAVQFNLLELKHGTGYKVTDLFIRIALPEDDFEKKRAIVESLRTPEIYNEILSEYNGRVFLTQQGLINILLRKYNFKENIAQRISDLLFKNLREYSLLNSSNVLNLNLPKENKVNDKNDDSFDGGRSKEQETKNDKNDKNDENGILEITVPLKNKKKAFIRIPEDFDDNDIDKIARIVKAYKQNEDKEKEQP